VILTLVSFAFAFDAALEPAPDGCWGEAQDPAPTAGAVDVPLDAALRFWLDGLCATVGVEIVGPDDLPVALDVAITSLGSTTGVVATPTMGLDPDTTYTVTVLPEFGVEQAWSFTTGAADSDGEPPAFTLTADGNSECSGRDVVTELWVHANTDAVGYIGYLASDPAVPGTYQPLVAADGSASGVLVGIDASGRTELCGSVALFADDGTLGDWAEACASVDDPRPCRGVLSGCGGRDDTVPVEAGLLLPFLGLLRRRRVTG
jgi:hypothetical protein